MLNVFDITEFGAVPNSELDCTNAIQNALDQAGKVKGKVIIPPGIYKCGYIKIPSSVTLSGTHGWGYRDIGGSVLSLNDQSAECLIDLTDGHGCKIEGLQLVGNGLGKNTHGMRICWELYNGNGEKFFDGYSTKFHEDSFTIEDCQVRGFTGNGVHLEKVFAFTIRNSHFIENEGNGIYIDGWDGWINNCIFSFNRKYGLCGNNNTSALTILGNRVEWNRLGGFYFQNGGSLIINSNAFDRNMGPAIEITDNPDFSQNYTIVGNNFNRNGKARKTPFEHKYKNSHIFLSNGKNAVVSQNIFLIGADDGGGGPISPEYGIVVENMKGCIISNNALIDGAVKEKIVTLGENYLIENNNLF